MQKSSNIKLKKINQVPSPHMTQWSHPTKLIAKNEELLKEERYYEYEQKFRMLGLRYRKSKRRSKEEAIQLYASAAQSLLKYK